jgi:hypothetical protein
MGEHATFQGQTIKIGTCENLYYLRHDQRHLIERYDFSPDDFRYRFPFPDEDHLEPGQFDDHGRGIRIPGGYSLSDQPDHGIVQFTAYAGYNLCIPCPEQFGHAGLGPVPVELPDGGTIGVHRNGFNGSPKITQQRELDGLLWTIVDCGSCGGKWRLTLEQAAAVADLFLDEATRREYRQGDYVDVHSVDTQIQYAQIAGRILSGYRADLPTGAR